MNIFQEAKQILDKDGKVNPLGPYGKSKLTGQEVAQYFRKNKVSDSKIKKAVEVALDLGGAMDIARKEIKKFYGDKILKSKEVQSALRFANEEVIGEGKNLVPAVKKIVDTKGAAKVGGVMIDMFTASMISQIYDKVNDQNKKKMENSNIQTLVGLAQKMMQRNSVEEGANPAQQAAIAISKKEKAGKPGYDKEGKSLKKESVLDAYRKMWEDASDITEVSDKEINAMKKVSKDMQKVLKDYQKIANMGDKELKNTKHNYDYEQVLKARDTIISMIGKLQTRQTIEKSFKNEELEEKMSKADLKFIDMMYDKKGNLTDVGKAVMNYKPGDNIRKIVQNLNNKKK